MPLTHLDRLEAEAIHIIREVATEFRKPVLMYSVGKDSQTMLYLARKAFYPGRIPFPILMVDTTWNFQEMYTFRDALVKDWQLDLIVHINEEGLADGINPFDHGSALFTEIMNLGGLRQAMDIHTFDAALGGGRRDEEKSRAKERIFSFRAAGQRWDPKGQRPELWRTYNARLGPDESMRVFPLSNWTEADIWQYIWREQIPLVPLYFAKLRPVVERDGMLIMVDDQRMPLMPDETPEMRMVRFRTLGDYPLTGAVESDADSLEKIIAETITAGTSERAGRVIDNDHGASMERKKQQGYY